MDKQNKIKKIKLSDYDVLSTLGTGSFGRVKLAKNKSTGKYIAIKMLRKTDLIKLKQVDHVANENKILSQLDHPFIVKMEGFTQDSKHLYFALEFVPGGELFTYLRGIGKLETQYAAEYAAQVALTFQYLHSKNIVYRDLKPENLLISEEGYLKLTDFGFAKVVENRTFTLCGTPEYLAPEILLNQGHGKPVDWWTLGILIYQMNAGIDPFTDQDPMNIYQNILKGRISFPKDFDRDAKSIVKHLLVSDLSQRYGCLKNKVDDIKNHRWFSKIDWKDLYNKKGYVHYKPKVKSAGDTSNFGDYPDSDTPAVALQPSEDPFVDW